MNIATLERLIHDCGYNGKQKIINASSGQELMINCPFHGERNPSLGINSDKEVYSCFACGAKGNLEYLIAKLKEIPVNEALLFLIDYNYYAERDAEKKSDILQYDEKEEKTKLSKTMIAPFRGGRAIHTYMLKRGFNLETLRKFQIGWNSETKKITIPMFDLKGELLGWNERTVLNEKDKNYNLFYKNQPKYKLHHLKKSKLLFPLNLVDLDKDLILVEGTLDVIWLHQIGLTNSLSIINASFNKDQANLLKKIARNNNIILFLDNDEAGKKAEEKVYKFLRDEFTIYSLVYPEGKKDPCDIDEKTIKEMINKKEYYKKRVKIDEYR